MSQIKLARTTTSAIMRQPHFARGLADIRAGRPFDTSLDDDYWAYERGRLFGAIAPLSMPLFNGKSLNPKAVALCDAAFQQKANHMIEKVGRDIKVIVSDLQIALKRETADIIAIGDLLLEAQEQVEHGDWLTWLKRNFGSSIRTARNYMNAARFASKYATVAHLKLRPSALYFLGQPDGSYSSR